MRSSAEIAAEENVAKVEALIKRRHDAFVDGLESLDSFDMERIEKDIPKAKYVEDAFADLKKIMARGATISKAKPWADD
jgi:hypothetical protein